MIYIMPNAGVKPVIRFINYAKRDLDVNVYYLSDKPILNAIRYAVKRGVDVKIMIAGKPYRMAIRKEEQEIKKTGAHFEINRMFDKKYVFDHAKYIVDNHEALIGTANFDWSAFHKNREYEYTTYKQNIINSLKRIFNSDYNSVKFTGYINHNLVVSPGSTQRILSIINQPGQIDIETEEMGYDKPIIYALARKGEADRIRIIVPSSVSNYDKTIIIFLEKYGVKFKFMPIRIVYMHAKMIVGNKKAFIGSENFTYTSLNKNREVGIILHNNHNNLNKLKNRFNKDWDMAR